MRQNDRGFLTARQLAIVIPVLSIWFATTSTIGQEKDGSSAELIRAGNIEFRFASIEQGQTALQQEDLYIQNLSAFDRQVRMRTETDPGNEAFRQFAAGEVIEWPVEDRAAIREAIKLLDVPLSDLVLPNVGPVLLVHTTGREESGAAYTRGTTIVLPEGKAGTTDKPPHRLIAHELFHVLSRADSKWRDQLYSIIGFQPTGVIRLPTDFANRRITNPDAPETAHAIEVRLTDERTAFVTPILLAKSPFDPQQTSLFRYIDFQLMEVQNNEATGWGPVMAKGKLVRHAPSIPDFHRQIGRNTSYIIHPEETLADNFVILATNAKAKDPWIIEAMRSVCSGNQQASDR